MVLVRCGMAGSTAMMSAGLGTGMRALAREDRNRLTLPNPQAFLLMARWGVVALFMFPFVLPRVVSRDRVGRAQRERSCVSSLSVALCAPPPRRARVAVECGLLPWLP